MRENKGMRKVAKDIIDLELPDEMIQDVKDMFFEVMRNNGVKLGTKNESGNGITMSNPEWTMCRVLFLDQLVNKLEWNFIMDMMDIPEDLKCYLNNNIKGE
jgi:hypothetical protein